MLKNGFGSAFRDALGPSHGIWSYLEKKFSNFFFGVKHWRRLFEPGLDYFLHDIVFEWLGKIIVVVCGLWRFLWTDLTIHYVNSLQFLSLEMNIQFLFYNCLMLLPRNLLKKSIKFSLKNLLTFQEGIFSS